MAQTRWIVRIAIGFAYQRLIEHDGVTWGGARNVDFPTDGMAWYALTAETWRMYDVMSNSQRYPFKKRQHRVVAAIADSNSHTTIHVGPPLPPSIQCGSDSKGACHSMDYSPVTGSGC